MIMWDPGAMRRALYRAAEERAQETSDELVANGKLQDKVSVKTQRNIYEINISSIKLKTLFNTRAHYIRRNDFIKAFAPLVGAVIADKFNDEYDPANDSYDFIKQLPLNEKPGFRHFCDENIIPAKDRGFSNVGSLWIEFMGGASYKFQVPFRQSKLYEETITSSREKGALLEFAKSYMQASHDYGPHPKYDSDDYMQIKCNDKPLETAYKALARISSKLHDKPYEDMTKEEKHWHAASKLITLKTHNDVSNSHNDVPEQKAPSLWGRLQNALKL